MKSSQIFFLLPLAVTLIGCGGNGGSSSNGSAANKYAGTYRSVIGLDSGKTGTLDLVAARNGSATGTLKVEAARAVSRGEGFSFTVGTMEVSGTVGKDGTFNLNGTDPNAGNFTIEGNLPLGNGTGNLTVNAGDQSYGATIGINMGTGSGSLTFSNIDGAGISGTPFPSNPYILVSTVSGNSAIVAIPAMTDSSRAFRILLNSTAVPGDSITLSGILNGKATVFYEEGQSGHKKEWTATEGTLQVVARNGNNFTLKLVSAYFTPSSGDVPSTGSFAVNGSLTK